jgi:hypothetical protein
VIGHQREENACAPPERRKQFATTASGRGGWVRRRMPAFRFAGDITPNEEVEIEDTVD